MISMARSLGAPESVPAGKVAASASKAVVPGAQLADDGRHDVHDVAVALDVQNSATSTVPGRADPAQVVAAEVDEHHVLGALLRVGEQLRGERVVLLRGRAPRAGAGDRVQHRPPARSPSVRLRGATRRRRSRRRRSRRSGAGTCTGSGCRRAAPGRRRAASASARRSRSAGTARSGRPRRPGSPPWPRSTGLGTSAGARLLRTGHGLVDGGAVDRGDHLRRRPRRARWSSRRAGRPRRS